MKMTKVTRANDFIKTLAQNRIGLRRHDNRTVMLEPFKKNSLSDGQYICQNICHACSDSNHFSIIFKGKIDNVICVIHQR